jgi:hypothetical protein
VSGIFFPPAGFHGLPFLLDVLPQAPQQACGGGPLFALKAGQADVEAAVFFGDDARVEGEGSGGRVEAPHAAVAAVAPPLYIALGDQLLDGLGGGGLVDLEQGGEPGEVDAGVLADAGEEDELAALQAEAAEDEVVDRPDAAGQRADLAEDFAVQGFDSRRPLSRNSWHFN